MGEAFWGLSDVDPNALRRRIRDHPIRGMKVEAFCIDAECPVARMPNRPRFSTIRPALSSSGGFFLAALVFQAVSVQVDHREAQIVISPDQLAIFREIPMALVRPLPNSESR